MAVRTLITAGAGPVGIGVLKLGTDFLERFERVIVLDLEPPSEPLPAGIEFLQLDVFSEEATALFARFRNEFMLINLCNGTDNLLLRRTCALNGGIYLDACCSMTEDRDEWRIEKFMDRTFAPVPDGGRPHMVCAGINPGMVEITAKKMILDHFRGCRVNVGFFEWDTINADMDPGKLAASWSPEVMTEEIMLYSSMYIKDGEVVDDPTPPSVHIDAVWDGRQVPSRLVSHEEVWNMTRIRQAEVMESFFCYAFGRPLMKALAGEVDEARSRIELPAWDQPVYGTDTIVVKVEDADGGRAEARCWACDHADCFDRLGVNGVQFQTCSSLLVFAELILDGKVSRPSPFCASDLDVEELRGEIRTLQDRYNVEWTAVDPGCVELADGLP